MAISSGVYAINHYAAGARGTSDFYADYDLSDNPYPVGTALAEQWTIGFIAAAKESDRLP